MAIKNGPKTADKKGGKKTEPRNDSSKVFDETWLKMGGPKYYGCVTVYVDQKTKKYRIKPEPGSRQYYKLVWSTTEEQQQLQWRKLMETVREYNRNS